MRAGALLATATAAKRHPNHHPRARVTAAFTPFTNDDAMPGWTTMRCHTAPVSDCIGAVLTTNHSLRCVEARTECDRLSGCVGVASSGTRCLAATCVRTEQKFGWCITLRRQSDSNESSVRNVRPNEQLGCDASKPECAMSVLALILSNEVGGAEAKREAIRSSWLRAYSGRDFQHLFVIGMPPSWKWPPTVSNDELRLPTDDRYNGLAAKVLDALRWAISSRYTWRYLLKVDDDSLLCVPELMSWLHEGGLPLTRAYSGEPKLNRDEKAKHLYAPPAADNDFGRAINIVHVKGKWADLAFVSIFNRTTYSRYFLGGGYMLSWDVASAVVERAARGGLYDRRLRQTSELPTVEDGLVGTLAEGATDYYEMGVCRTRECKKSKWSNVGERTQAYFFASSALDGGKFGIRADRCGTERLCARLIQARLVYHSWCATHWSRIVLIHPVRADSFGVIEKERTSAFPTRAALWAPPPPPVPPPVVVGNGARRSGVLRSAGQRSVDVARLSAAERKEMCRVAQERYDVGRIERRDGSWPEVNSEEFMDAADLRLLAAAGCTITETPRFTVSGKIFLDGTNGGRVTTEGHKY